MTENVSSIVINIQKKNHTHVMVVGHIFFYNLHETLVDNPASGK
jgi:hypothetical protein